MKDCMDFLDKMSKSNNKLVAKYGEDSKKYYSEVKQYQNFQNTLRTHRRLSRPKAPTSPKIDIKADTLNKWKELVKTLRKFWKRKLINSLD